MSPEIRPEVKMPQLETQQEINRPQNGVFEKISRLANKLLAIAGIGLVATLGANKLANGQNEAIASSNPEALSSSLKASMNPALRECVKSGLKAPKIKAEMFFPGKRDQSTTRVAGNRQSIGLVVTHDAMRPECDEEDILRIGLAKYQFKDKRTPKRWRSIQWYWQTVYRAGNQADTGGAIVLPTGHEPDYWYFKSPGKARVLYKTRLVRDKPTRVPNKDGGYSVKRPVVAEKTIKRPIKIHYNR